MSAGGIAVTRMPCVWLEVSRALEPLAAAMGPYLRASGVGIAAGTAHADFTLRLRSARDGRAVCWYAAASSASREAAERLGVPAVALWLPRSQTESGPAAVLALPPEVCSTACARRLSAWLAQCVGVPAASPLTPRPARLREAARLLRLPAPTAGVVSRLKPGGTVWLVGRWHTWYVAEAGEKRGYLRADGR